MEHFRTVLRGANAVCLRKRVSFSLSSWLEYLESNSLQLLCMLSNCVRSYTY